MTHVKERFSGKIYNPGGGGGLLTAQSGVVSTLGPKRGLFSRLPRTASLSGNYPNALTNSTLKNNTTTTTH